MSEATTKSSSSAKDGKDSTTSSSGDDGAKAKKSSDDDAPAKTSEKSSEKSSAKSNGASEVYYGKFSNVKNPAYRGGWDDIWGAGDRGDKAPAKKKPVRKKNLAPVVLDLDMAEMPEDLRAGLAQYAQAELKRQKSRLSYDARDKAGSVDWRITCRIER
jgi:hypothetical protein